MTDIINKLLFKIILICFSKNGKKGGSFEIKKCFEKKALAPMSLANFIFNSFLIKTTTAYSTTEKSFMKLYYL